VTVNYSATFEFDVLPPLTATGTVRASTMPTCFARAAREAAKAYPGRQWTSMVIVLLERVPDAKPETASKALAKSTEVPHVPNLPA
jgi:hypothetical protein